MKGFAERLMIELTKDIPVETVILVTTVYDPELLPWRGALLYAKSLK